MTPNSFLVWWLNIQDLMLYHSNDFTAQKIRNQEKKITCDACTMIGTPKTR
jgi:hypothetical protein